MSLYWSFAGLTMCPLMLPAINPPKPQTFTFSGFIQQIPNVIIGNYPRCSPYPSSESLQAAITFVYNFEIYGSLFFNAVLSYILACGIVYIFIKHKSKNTKKK